MKKSEIGYPYYLWFFLVVFVIAFIAMYIFAVDAEKETEKLKQDMRQVMPDELTYLGPNQECLENRTVETFVGFDNTVCPKGYHKYEHNPRSDWCCSNSNYQLCVGFIDHPVPIINRTYCVKAHNIIEVR